MKQSFIKICFAIAAASSPFSASAICTVEWPAEALQLHAVLGAVKKASPGATVTNVKLAANGRATASVRNGKAPVELVAMTYEFRTVDCLRSLTEAERADELMKNPMLFRVLSYSQLQSNTK